jgi:hypothetical protein
LKSKKPKGIGKKIISAFAVTAIMSLIVFMTIPPDYFDTPLVGQTVNLGDDSELIAQTSLGFLQNSIVETNIIYHESDDPYIKRIADELGLTFDDNLGIAVDVTLVNSDGKKISSTNVVSISELPDTLSIIGEQGELLDNGGMIQLLFKSITPNIPKSATVWATGSVFLDDNKIDGKDIHLYSSYQNESEELMAVLDNLSFDDTGFPNFPGFDQVKNTNYTFDFNDENLSDGPHIFRVVIDQVDGIVDNQVYSFKGFNIFYELTFIVDNDKITKESESGNGEQITVFKSDSTLQFSGDLKTVGTISPSVSYYGAYQPRVAIFDADMVLIYDSIDDPRMGIDGRIIGWAGVYSDPPSSKPNTDIMIYDGLTRDADYIIRVYDPIIGTTDYPYHTKLSQENLGIGCTLDLLHQTNYPSKAWHLHTHGCTSTFGYESPDYIGPKV